jgi:hypothetical protein
VCPCPTTRVRQPLSGETAPIGSEVDRRLLACGVPCHRSPGPAAQYFGERHFRAAKTVGSPPLHLHSLPSGLPVEDVHVTTALNSPNHARTSGTGRDDCSEFARKKRRSPCAVHQRFGPLRLDTAVRRARSRWRTEEQVARRTP